MTTRKLRHRGFWRFTAIALIAVVVIASLLPAPPEPPGPLGWDKLQHTATYAFLTWWCLQVWEARRALLWCLLLMVIGCAVEGLQALTPARDPSLLDVVANALGVGLGALAWRGPLRHVLARLDALT